LRPCLDLVARGRLERHAVETSCAEGRAAYGLERGRCLDVRREAVVEEVSRADAIGELLVAGARAGLRVAVGPVVAAVQSEDETVNLDLVLEIDADLLLGLVNGSKYRDARNGCRVVHRIEQVDRRRRAEAKAEFGKAVVVPVIHAEEQVLLDAAAAPQVDVEARVGV
jgi:hypothetical protein